ncbi:hypothetical protein HPB49_024644 [Dermacentor silvarum]|uniref:Uncharacterized protein n=1 Tax=Dermacentor silvarum TaxID=543639 RepID=A0ACB8D180_DERSI|nr:hypothetical protein HPB49_024644 [Dermacentor silvarum]
MLQSRQAQRCLQVLPEAQEQSPPLGRRPEKPLLLETSLPGHHQGVATISLGAAHAQLRRLRNCSSSLLKEATVTCVAPHHSKEQSKTRYGRANCLQYALEQLTPLQY